MEESIISILPKPNCWNRYVEVSLQCGHRGQMPLQIALPPELQAPLDQVLNVNG